MTDDKLSWGTILTIWVKHHGYKVLTLVLAIGAFAGFDEGMQTNNILELVISCVMSVMAIIGFTLWIEDAKAHEFCASTKNRPNPITMFDNLHSPNHQHHNDHKTA